MKSFYLSAAIGFLAVFSANAYDFSEYYDFVIETNGKGEKMIVGAEQTNFGTLIDIPAPAECTSITIPSDIMEIAGNALASFGCSNLKLENSSKSLTVETNGLNGWQLDKLYMGRNTNCPFGFKNGGKVEMGKHVTEIAGGQFQNAVELSFDNITWSPSLTTIGDNAFEGCQLFYSVRLPETITKLGRGCFKDCQNITELKLNENLKTIGAECFSGCSSLKSITIPASVERLDECAFRGCDALVKVVIEDSETPMTWVDSTYSSWLYGHISPFYLDPLEEVYIGRDITTEYYHPGAQEWVYNPGSLFHYIESIKKVTIGDKVTTIRPEMFMGTTQLETVTIGNSVKEIKRDAFTNCGSLKEVIYPDGIYSLTHIGSRAFGYCESLSVINIPEGVTTIEDYAYSGCKGAKSINIPSTVKKIPIRCFEQCESVEGLKIPENVDSICDAAFYDCLSLKDIHIADSKNPLTIENWQNEYHFTSVFENCPVENIYQGRNVISDTQYFTFDYDVALSTLQSVWLGDLVTELTDGFPCESLTQLRLSPALKLIGRACFTACSSLESIDLPDGLETIGDYAFFGCESLKDIVFPESLKEIGDYAFDGCSAVTELTVPKNVRKVGVYAFLNVPLKRLVLEDGVEHLGYGSFTGGEDDPCIQTIIVNSPVPPICDEYYGVKDPFENASYMYSDLIVPSGSQELYATADVWKNFRRITSDVQTIDREDIRYELKDGIIHVNGLTGSHTLRIYNIDGTLIYSGSDSEISLPHKGTYILNFGSSIEKIVY